MLANLKLKGQKSETQIMKARFICYQFKFVMETSNLVRAEADNMEVSPGQISDINLLLANQACKCVSKLPFAEPRKAVPSTIMCSPTPAISLHFTVTATSGNWVLQRQFQLCVTLKSEVVGEAVTGRRGKYRVTFKGDRHDQQCLAVLVNSPISNCQFPDPSRNTATIILTRSNGIASTRHFANAMGFFRDQPLRGCATLRKHYLSDGDYRAI
ncbi:hypothetical protein DY000_02019370 [Brassica cretica]|uniref:Uncharacterized protein n=1 Tax=Brassica cretica TaxID=69181 RepID=A0ABQ7DAE3_BRACR|nr:hypothetical protein DY000_02019370 [Brassica cretica]